MHIVNSTNFKNLASGRDLANRVSSILSSGGLIAFSTFRDAVLSSGVTLDQQDLRAIAASCASALDHAEFKNVPSLAAQIRRVQDYCDSMQKINGLDLNSSF